MHPALLPPHLRSFAGLLVLTWTLALSGGECVVTNASESELRAALACGDVVRMSFEGELVLSNSIVINHPTSIVGSSGLVILSGNNACRIFEVAETGRLWLTNIILSHGQSPEGGAILNRGELTAYRCEFRSNRATAPLPIDGITCYSGGAIFNSGVATVVQSTFSGNSAQGGWFNESRCGGAVYSRGELELNACLFTNNSCLPQSMTTSSEGGALYNTGIAQVNGSTFTDNAAVGGSRTNSPPGLLEASSAFGGAIYSTGEVSLTNTTFASNMAKGGDTIGGYVPNAWGVGGAIYVRSGQLALSFCTLAGNKAIPGHGSWGTPGRGLGSAIYIDSEATASLHSSIIAYQSEDAINGSFADLGYNVCSHTCAGLTHSTSKTQIDPLLGGFASGSSPAAPLVLLPESPVINLGGTLSSTPTDQRGVARPQYANCDPGAYEFDGQWPAVFEFASTMSRVVERDQEVIVTVSRRGNVDTAATVTCVATDGTAEAGIDYIATNITLAFASGEQSRSFRINLLPDDNYEETETIQLWLTNPSVNAALGLASNAIVEIAQNALTDLTSGAELRKVASEGGVATFGKSGVLAIERMTITNDVTIDGTGRNVTLTGWGRFFVTQGATLKMHDITLAGASGYMTSVVHNVGGTIELLRCRFESNVVFGRPGDYSIDPSPRRPATPGRGGVILNESGTILVRDCAFTGNVAAGGRGGDYYTYPGGGASYGGAIYNAASLAIVNSTFEANTATGGAGNSNAANGYGGAIFNVGRLALTNSTFARNTAASGAFGIVGLDHPAAYGGGLFNGGGTSILHHVTFADNLVSTTNHPNWRAGQRFGFNIASTNGEVVVINSLIAGEAGTTNCFGILTDAGHNLSSDASCGFTNSGSMNSTNPMLLSLADNGGFSRTAALQWGSPAIDAALSTGEVLFDQRGVPRPFAAAPDIGAYEANQLTFHLASFTRIGDAWVVDGWGAPSHAFTVEQSTNLTHWSSLTNDTTTSTGFLRFRHLPSEDSQSLFFRIVFD